jgi:hypothetical protein
VIGQEQFIHFSCWNLHESEIDYVLGDLGGLCNISLNSALISPRLYYSNILVKMDQIREVPTMFLISEEDSDSMTHIRFAQDP